MSTLSPRNLLEILLRRNEHERHQIPRRRRRGIPHQVLEVRSGRSEDHVAHDARPPVHTEGIPHPPLAIRRHRGVPDGEVPRLRGQQRHEARGDIHRVQSGIGAGAALDEEVFAAVFGVRGGVSRDSGEQLLSAGGHGRLAAEGLGAYDDVGDEPLGNCHFGRGLRNVEGVRCRGGHCDAIRVSEGWVWDYLLWRAYLHGLSFVYAQRAGVFACQCGCYRCDQVGSQDERIRAKAERGSVRTG
mmetsp:Transcript_29724/g.54577  ORF Transcript_29724/g.54577 Transcript_29724/m.54577 type:complete len:243 (-) Transcript_29724:1091-1819(-)